MSLPTNFPINDIVGAWVPHGRFQIDPIAAGPLSGLTFAAKDLFDVAGHPTGAGNPTWLATHPVPTQHSAVIAHTNSGITAFSTAAGKVTVYKLKLAHKTKKPAYAGSPLTWP